MNRFTAEVTTPGGRVTWGHFAAEDEAEALRYLYSTDGALELRDGLVTYLIARHHIESVAFWSVP